MKSEIRVSEVNALLDRVRKKSYRKYLSHMKLVRLRGFRNAEINFEFPVTALVDPNGAGKTTILGAAGLIYEEVKPRRFFAKSGKYDDSMQDWRVEYELIDRDQQETSSTSRTASYLRAKWNRDAVCQVIFTTRSNDALAPLPTNAVWAAYAGKPTQGKLDVTALRTLTGQVDARLAVFTEDRFSELVADVTLRSYGHQLGLNIDRAGIEIHSLGGAEQARNHTRYYNSNPTRKFPAVALIDGDKGSDSGYQPKISAGHPAESDARDIIFNPGDSGPEDYVFARIADNFDTVGNLVAKLTLALTLDTSDQQKVRKSIEARELTNRDRHLIFDQIGEDLDFLSESVVQRAFLVTRRLNDIDPSPWPATPRELTRRDTPAGLDAPVSHSGGLPGCGGRRAPAVGSWQNPHD